MRTSTTHREQAAPQVLAKTVWNCDMPGPYIPLTMVLVVGGVFMTMLLVSTEQATKYKAERDQARAELEELTTEITRIDARISVLRKEMNENELSLHKEYMDMMQVPPIWPEEALTAKQKNNPPVFVPSYRRKQYVNYIATRSGQRYTRFPCDPRTYAGPGTDGTEAPAVSLR